MKKKIKKQWIEALRSGEYRQGQQDLWGINDSNEEVFCCLGVLTNLYVEDTGNDASEIWDAHYLQSKVTVWAGLSRRVTLCGDVEVCVGAVQTTLAKLNDGCSNFDEIADIIEENL